MTNTPPICLIITFTIAFSSINSSFAQSIDSKIDSIAIAKELNDLILDSSFNVIDFGESIETSKRVQLILPTKERGEYYEDLIREQEEFEKALRQEEIDEYSRREPDRSAAYSVGSIPVQQDVSPYGARTYTIPIPTTPGYHLVPSISVAYNSLATEGLLGYGWDLHGLSSISLINKKEYYHDEVRAASSTATDAAFSLDGDPLVTNTDSSFPLYGLLPTLGYYAGLLAIGFLFVL